MIDDRDQRLHEALLELTPPPTQTSDWTDVMRRAGGRRRIVWRRTVPAIALASVVGGLAVALVRIGQRALPPATKVEPRIGLFDRARDERDRSSGFAEWRDYFPQQDPDQVWFSQEFAVDGETNRVFLGRGSESVCVILQLPSYGNCVRTIDIADDGVATFAWRDVTVGVVADGVTEARRDPASQPARVVANTFALPKSTETPDLQVRRNGEWVWTSPHYSLLDDSANVRPVSSLVDPDISESLQGEGMARTVERDGLRITVALGTSGFACLRVVGRREKGENALACESNDLIYADRGLAVAVRVGSRWRIVTLVPDDVREARFAGRDVAVTDNLLVTEAATPELPEVRLATAGWNPVLGAVHGLPDAGQAIFLRPRTEKDALPADARATAARVVERLRPESTYFSQEQRGVGFWKVSRDDANYVITSAGQVRVADGPRSDGISIVNSPVDAANVAWEFGPIIDAPDGYESARIGNTTVSFVQNLAVFPKSVSGSLLTVSGPRGIVRLQVEIR